MLSELQFKNITAAAEGQSLGGIWCRLDKKFAYNYDAEDGDKDPFPPGIRTFTEKRDAFLWVLERLLKEGRIRLHKDGKWLEGNPQEIVGLFRKAFPVSELASGYDDFSWWFFDDDCPGEPAWRRGDTWYFA